MRFMAVVFLFFSLLIPSSAQSAAPAQSPAPAQTAAPTPVSPVQTAAPAQSAAPAPAGSGALRGQVTDPSGAAITGASVIMTPATGSPIVVQSNAQGLYEFKTLPAGKYTLTVAAPEFTLYENDSVVVADQPLRLNVAMAIERSE